MLRHAGTQRAARMHKEAGLPRPHLQLVSLPTRVWSFIMSNPEQFEIVCDRIDAGNRPRATMRVWMKIVTRIDWNTGAVPKAADLAAVTGLPDAEVRRALGDLVRHGGIVRVSRGNYIVNPEVVWRGGLIERAQVADRVRPALRMVDPVPA